MAETKTGDKLRVGIVGCGIAIFHLEGFEKENRAEVVALAGLDTDRCVSLQERFKVPRRYREYQELLADPEIDAITVAVPNHLHKPVTLAALEAGKHVLVEKPLAQNSVEGEEIVRAAEASGKVVMILFNRRGRHDVQIVQKLSAAGTFGRIYHAKAFWMRRSGIPGLGSWFTNKAQAGGGPVIDLGVHVLDMALWVMGNPKPVAVAAAAYNELGTRGKGQWQGARFSVTPGVPYEVEDFATALIRMEDGATLQLDASWAGYTRHTDEFGVSFMGTDGGAEIHAKDYGDTGTLKIFGDIDGAPTVTEPRLLSRRDHGELISRWVDAILGVGPVSPSVQEGLDRVRLIESIYRSAELGREIPID